MRLPQFTTSGMMAVVVLAAVDCFLIQFWDALAGAFLMGLALQVGLFVLIRSRARGHHFCVGFEATGLAALLIYVPGHRAYFNQVIVPWTFDLSGAVDRALRYLPYHVFGWYRRHLVVDPNNALRIIDIIALQEVSFGLPMLLLASIGGLLALFSRRCRATLPFEPAPAVGLGGRLG
ncbi:hypothetical protein ACYOEI_09325 [Singulisphaera rosea]